MMLLRIAPQRQPADNDVDIPTFLRR